MSKYRVLVVEDDKDMASMLEVTLSDEFDVFVCTEKAHAIVRAKEFFRQHDAPDVVVIDLIINGEGGVDLYHWMRDHGYNAPLVFLTGCHRESPEYQMAMSTGEAIYEKDHFSSRQLANLLVELMEEKKTGTPVNLPQGVHQQR